MALDAATGAWLRGIQNAGQDPVEAAILAKYGYMGAFLHHPEIGPLLRQAATNGWTKEVLQGALFKTAWYQQTSAQARQYALLKSSDPAEAQRVLQQKQLDILEMFTTSGIEAKGGLARAGQIAEQALAQGLSDAQLKAMVAAEAHYDPAKAGQQAPGTMLQTQQKIKAMAYDQLLPMSDESAFNWAQKIAAGTITEDAVTSSLRQQAISRFPQFAAELQHGVSVKEIAAPYAEQAAKLLEIGPETIDMTDAKYARMIDTRDDKGQKTSMSLADAATYVRGLDSWQYTQNAHEEAAGMAENISKTFGKVG